MIVDVILENKKPKCQPTVHEMARSDTIQWKCAVGAITIDFVADSPFTRKPPQWTAAAGEPTEVATVDPNAPPRVFFPRVSLTTADGTITDQGQDVGAVKIKET